jgi:mannan endo-1,4-beta-mannosidase
MLRSILVTSFACLTACAVFGQTFRFEAELGSYGSASVHNCASGTGCSGTGYVSFQNDSTSSFVQVSASIPAGLYELWVGYNSPFGYKGYDFQVNQTSGSGGLDGNGNQFGVDRAGMFELTQPTNTLRVNRGWGWYNVDYFELRPFTPPTLLPVSAQLVDPLADLRTRQLMNYLVSQYGNKTLSGQQGQVGSNVAFPTADYLNKSGGVVPAIRGSDFIDYSPSRIQFGANPNGESERVIQWAKQTGGIVSMMWHWNAPTDLINTPGKEWWRGFYTDATTFDVQAALANPAGPKYQLLLRDIDAIAGQLQKFEDAGVPVLWRPLH